MLKRKLEPIPETDFVLIRNSKGHALGSEHLEVWYDEGSHGGGETYLALRRGESVEIGVEEYKWSRLQSESSTKSKSAER